MNDATTGRQAAAILAGLGWPAGIHTERLAASVYGRAMRSGMFEAAVIMGYTFDRTEFPAVVSRDDRLTVALHALCRFAADNGRLEDLRFDGRLVPDDVLRFDGRLVPDDVLRSDGRLVPDGTIRSGTWTAASPMLPSMHGLYEAARREWVGARFGGSREPESRK